MREPALALRWLHFHPVARLLLAAALATAMGGCSSLRGAPVRYANSDEVVKAINLTPEELATLQSATTEGERNHYQNKAIAIIDQRYNQFVRDLLADRADASTAQSGATLAASTAGAFVDSVAAKTNYALFAAGVTGAFGIVDRNYFYEKTVPALVAAMGAARANVLLRMRSGQAEPLGAYDGVAALADIEDYFSAGTFLSAISEITTRAESDKQLALREVRTMTVPTESEIARRRRLSQAILSIDEQGLANARNAAAALGLAEQKTVRETRLTLLRAMRPPTRERLDLVEKALRDAGILK